MSSVIIPVFTLLLFVIAILLSSVDSASVSQPRNDGCSSRSSSDCNNIVPPMIANNSSEKFEIPDKIVVRHVPVTVVYELKRMPSNNKLNDGDDTRHHGQDARIIKGYGLGAGGFKIG